MSQLSWNLNLNWVCQICFNFFEKVKLFENVEKFDGLNLSKLFEKCQNYFEMWNILVNDKTDIRMSKLF